MPTWYVIFAQTIPVTATVFFAARHQGRDKEAKVLLQRALETVEKFFGPEHPVAVQLRAILGPGGWGGDEGL